jgi:RNA polymerase sigma factor (sigma-70 family)
MNMKYNEWFESIYHENEELLQEKACSFVMAKLKCGYQEYMRHEEDVKGEIQEAFMLLWNRRIVLYYHQNIGGWLYNTVTNELMHWIRHHFTESAREGFSVDDEGKTGKAIISAIRQEEGDDSLVMDGYKAMLARLLGEQNAVIYFSCRVEGQSAKEVARRFGLSENAVWARLSRAQDILDQHKDEFL